jgi:ferrous iron transport protein B
LSRPLVAIVGNPNAGKTSLFNSLTGSHQKVGNYPGVTVEKAEGVCRLESMTVDMVDVPGLYSMNPVSEDERVAARVVHGNLEGEREPDLLVCVIDASALERNLFLFTQIAEVQRPTLVALTMVDRLESKGLSVDVPKLSNLLGTEVVVVEGHKSRGLEDLKQAIQRNIEEPKIPSEVAPLPTALEAKVSSLRESLQRSGMDVLRSEVRHTLLLTEPEFVATIAAYPSLNDEFHAARKELESLGIARPAVESKARYDWAEMVKRATIREEGPRPKSLTDRIDGVLTNRVFGFGVFVGVMYVVFLSIYTFAKPLMEWIDNGFGAISGWVEPKLAGVPMLQSMVVDGLIKGVGSVMVFLPQILILFFFIAVLEGTGYLARAAFLMDRLLGWCGLNGRAFIPLLSSFACAIPGIMAARVMPDQKSRLATILVAPLMSCSARLPVYLVIISTFIEPQFGALWAGVALFAMHLIGLVLAIPIIWFLNRKILKGRRLPFLLELPPYQWPRLKDIWMTMWFRGKVFVQTAGTIIVVMSIFIWAATYFPRLSPAAEAKIRATVPAEQADARVQYAQLEQSALGRFGKAIEPVFVPAGFDWRITTSILAAFPAREVVVPSMGIVFSLGKDVEGEDSKLHSALRKATWPDGRPLFTPWVGVGLMVFFALCCQCTSTLATIKRETNTWKWPTFVFVYMTILAYVFAVGIHQLARWLGKA